MHPESKIDDLDLVESVMNLEEMLKVDIPDHLASWSTPAPEFIVRLEEMLSEQ